MYADEAVLARLFSAMPEVLPVYHALEDRINEACGDVDVRAQRTQVTFTDRFCFAWASLPVRRRRGWPRIAVATEPHPARWTHHVLVERPEDVDDELMGWIEESHQFSLAKRRGGRS